MRYSELFGKTQRQDPKDEVSTNAKLLIRAGFVSKEVSGVYNFLPLGLRVLNKIANVVREEMNNAGGQEILLSALQNSQSWQKTGRWKSFDALFKVKSQYDQEYALGPTHEEVLVPIAREYVKSYRDLPIYLYQIQTKFRDEPRAKSGLLRGREFLMKDLYSFHTDEADMMNYYEAMKGVYRKVFERLGLEAIETKAAGGTFSAFSHEYQVVCENGEDEIIYCPKGDYSENVEIATAKDGQPCELGHGPLKRAKTIEVGNIFPLKDKFSKAFGLTYKDKSGKDRFAQMGCYGIGISRLMGAIVEVYNDDKGIIWPKTVSPYEVHLVHIEDPQTESWAKETYEKLTKAGIEVLWDDREDVTAGEKFVDCDLIGIPVRLVVSAKVGKGKIEFKKRDQAKLETISFDKVFGKIA
ncbi:MAG TPA: aminoacyl--tRNA ligase-related protein [Patescibacteria group bacterium]|nr:aminoacyl--tRNA ligase-related protein [Patescibacteria group bacterium]